jgi:hypothetical protein
MLFDAYIPNLFDRRADPRVSVDVAARCRPLGGATPMECRVRDISRGGLCAELPAGVDVEEGDYAELEFPVPDGSGKTVTKVKVERISEGEGVRVHARFLDRSLVFRRMIDDATVAWASAG